MNQKSANLGTDIALFCTPSWAHKPAHSFITLLVDLCCRCLSCPHHCLTDWGRQPLSAQCTSLSNQMVKCRYGRLLSRCPTETSMMRYFTIGQHQGKSANMLRTMGSQGASIQHGATRITVWVDLWHVLPETRTGLEELMQQKEMHNLPKMSKDGWRHSI